METNWEVRNSEFYKQNAIYRNGKWVATFQESEAAQKSAAYLVECANIRESLKDPAIVYANMLRGEIAAPKVSEVETLRTERDELRAALETVTSLCEAYSGHPIHNDKRVTDARAILAKVKP